jgi:hypothetical protein
MDYYGRKIAIGTSDGKISIFDNSSHESSKKLSEFTA